MKRIKCNVEGINTTKDLVDHIVEELGFDNWRHWTVSECAEWVKDYFETTAYVANKVAWYIA